MGGCVRLFPVIVALGFLGATTMKEGSGVCIRVARELKLSPGYSGGCGVCIRDILAMNYQY